MTKTILDIFYDNGGYHEDETLGTTDSYISPNIVTSTYIPQAIIIMNRLCDISLSYNSETTKSDGTLMDDLIIAEIALSLADSEYDKLHIDPETGQSENRHWQLAMKYMLSIYGIPVEDKFGRETTVLPANTSKPYGSMSVITMSE